MDSAMNTSSDEIEHETTEAEYGDEILDSGWNPDIGSMCQQLQLDLTHEQQAMPDELKAEAMESFLKKMYSYQR